MEQDWNKGVPPLYPQQKEGETFVLSYEPSQTYEIYIPPKPVGGWVIDPAASEGHGPCTMFTVYRKPTDEQVKNTEAMFGWKWKDLP